MDEIVTERSGGVLRVQLNRPAKKNALTSRMYVILADTFNQAGKDEGTRVVLWHGAGNSFSAGNDVEDFLRNPSRARRVSAGSADERFGRFRQTVGRSRAWCRCRKRNDHADAL